MRYYNASNRKVIAAAVPMYESCLAWGYLE
jgi:hypothetical protein